VNYGDLIRDAFRITWRNKFLWFFGFFVGGLSTQCSFPGGGGGGGGGFDDGGFDDTSSAVLVSAAQLGPPGLDQALPLIIAAVAVAVLLALVFVVLYLVSQGALAESVAAIDRGETRRFGSTFRAGLSNFWRVLGQLLLFVLIGLALLVAVGIPVALVMVLLFATTDAPGAGQILLAVATGLFALGLLVLIFVPLYIISEFALRGLVVGGEGIAGAIGGGYRLFRNNIGRSLLVWLISLALAIGIGIALIIALLLVGLVLFLPTIVLAFAGYSTAAFVTGAVAGLILLVLLVVVSGAVGTFGHAYWTLAYLRLRTPEAVRPSLPETPPPG
jgi:hypothetical protein